MHRHIYKYTLRNCCGSSIYAQQDWNYKSNNWNVKQLPIGYWYYFVETRGNEKNKKLYICIYM